MKLYAQPRRWWGAMAPLGEVDALQPPAKYVFFTSTKGQYGYSNRFCSQELLRLQARHMSAGAPDIVYNFMLGGNGMVFEGRGWYKCPKLAKKFQPMNSRSVFIAYMGIYEGSMPPAKMLRAGDWLVKHGISRGLIDKHFVEYRIANTGFDELILSTRVIN